MTDQAGSTAKLGPYLLTHRLGAGRLGERWLALHESDQTSHVIHRFRIGRERGEQTRFVDAMKRVTAPDMAHPHVLRVEDFGFDAKGMPWAATVFTGDRDGIITLDRHVRVKGAALSLAETKRALTQLLAAADHGHRLAVQHGEVTLSEVQVDRSGSLSIEMYGVARLLEGATAHQRAAGSDVERAEVKSILRIGYQLATGLRPVEPIIPAQRVLVSLDASWIDMFETGLGEPGFTTAAHALSAVAACKDNTAGAWGLPRVKTMIRGLLFTG